MTKHNLPYHKSDNSHPEGGTTKGSRGVSRDPSPFDSAQVQNDRDQLKQFIHTFNFPNPTWENIPADFPSIQTSELTKAEKGMLTGITIAWYMEKGKHLIYRRLFKLSFTISFSIIVGLYLRFITTTPAFTAVKEVSAATVSAGFKKLTVQRQDNFGDIFESTMSAQLQTSDVKGSK